MHFAWLVQFNCIECIQAIYTFFILDVEKGEKTLQNVIFINISYGDERLTIVKSYKKICVRILSSRYIVLKYWTTYFYS